MTLQAIGSVRRESRSTPGGGRAGGQVGVAEDLGHLLQATRRVTILTVLDDFVDKVCRVSSNSVLWKEMMINNVTFLKPCHQKAITTKLMYS